MTHVSIMIGFCSRLSARTNKCMKNIILQKQISKCFYNILILSQGESDHLMKGKRAEKLNEKTVCHASYQCQS